MQKNRPWILLQGTFLVKHKSKYSCKSAIYFDLGPYIIIKIGSLYFIITKQIYEIILAYWPDDKHIFCNVNGDIPVRIPSHPYVLVNRGVLCNCGIEAENNFLLESLAACHNSNSKLIMYFMVNTAFVNYLDQLDNLNNSLDVPILMDKTAFEQTLPISLNASNFDTDLLTAPKTIKDFIHQYHHEKENFDFNERHTNTDSQLSNKNFFLK